MFFQMRCKSYQFSIEFFGGKSNSLSVCKKLQKSLFLFIEVSTQLYNQVVFESYKVQKRWGFMFLNKLHIFSLCKALYCSNILPPTLHTLNNNGKTFIRYMYSSRFKKFKKCNFCFMFT